MRLAHLSDLHLRRRGDLALLERQLRAIARHGCDHLTISGDITEEWNPPILGAALDCLRAHGYGTASRATIIHGNHDLASTGAPERSGRGLRRAALRFWDPAPLLLWRRRRFYRAVADWFDPPVRDLPVIKRLPACDLLLIDSVPTRIRPLRVRTTGLELGAAVGTVRARDLRWLRQRRPAARPRIVVMHHYPLDTPPLGFPAYRVTVPMAIPPHERERLWTAFEGVSPQLVLCGHVHRSRVLEEKGILVGVQGQSGGRWPEHVIATYDVTAHGVTIAPAIRI